MIVSGSVPTESVVFRKQRHDAGSIIFEANRSPSADFPSVAAETAIVVQLWQRVYCPIKRQLLVKGWDQDEDPHSKKLLQVSHDQLVFRIEILKNVRFWQTCSIRSPVTVVALWLRSRTREWCVVGSSPGAIEDLSCCGPLHVKSVEIQFPPISMKHPVVWHGSFILNKHDIPVELHFMSGNTNFPTQCLSFGPLDERYLDVQSFVKVEEINFVHLNNELRDKEESCILIGIPDEQYKRRNKFEKAQRLSNLILQYLEAKKRIGVTQLQDDEEENGSTHSQRADRSSIPQDQIDMLSGLLSIDRRWNDRELEVDLILQTVWQIIKKCLNMSKLDAEAHHVQTNSDGIRLEGCDSYACCP
ncbi:hypothetical protein TNCV_66331 [Trichonephila clavipes]|nr:hypothetical protein TNCV_66331 [Trichonephila clavipes]